MTAALSRDHATGRFTARPTGRVLTCASCGRVLFENLAAALMCVWPKCELARQVVGHSGADAGVLAS